MGNYNLQKKDILCKTHTCLERKNGCFKGGYAMKSALNLYVRLTDNCQAHCKSCIYHNSCGEKDEFDYEKFEYVLKRLNEFGILSLIKFTGGEPGVDLMRLEKALFICDRCVEDAEYTINTNGLHLTELVDICLDKGRHFSSITLSRHHDSDERNNEYFGAEMITSDEIMGVQKKLMSRTGESVLNVNCILMRDYINNWGTLEKFLQYCSDMRFANVGLLNLMAWNDWCKENYVGIKEFNLSEPNVSIVAEHKNSRGSCFCTNYVYKHKGDSIQFYNRQSVSDGIADGVLVYDKDVLTQGFGGKVLL